MLIHKHIFKLEAVQKIIVPEYEGSTVRGGFGRALKIISPTYYYYLYGYKPTQVPRPYMLVPPLDTKTEYKKGEQFNFSLTLFGDACKLGSACYEAVEYFGSHLGLGVMNSKFKIISHKLVETDDQSIEGSINNKNSIRLDFVTRLMLKKNEKHTRVAPDFNVLIQRIIKRQQDLNRYYGNKLDDNQFDAVIKKSRQITIQADNTKWRKWKRFSKEQNKWMPFNGLMGRVVYQGEIESFIPILRLGEWIHVGNKTAFGLGKIRILGKI